MRLSSNSFNKQKSQQITNLKYSEIENYEENYLSSDGNSDDEIKIKKKTNTI